MWWAHYACEQDHEGSDTSLNSAGSGQGRAAQAEPREWDGFVCISDTALYVLRGALASVVRRHVFPRRSIWEKTGVCNILCICKQVLLCI